MSNAKEIWKQIPYTVGYKVSNLGRVMHPNGYEARVNIKISPSGKKYPCVAIPFKGRYNDSTRNLYISQYMAWAFFDKDYIEKGLVCDHIDNDPFNNTLDNLQLISQRDNIAKDSRRGKSKLLGAQWNSQYGRWVSKIVHKRKAYMLGAYNTDVEASNAYMKGLKRLKMGLNPKEPKYNSGEQIDLFK